MTCHAVQPAHAVQAGTCCTGRHLLYKTAFVLRAGSWQAVTAEKQSSLCTRGLNGMRLPRGGVLAAMCLQGDAAAMLCTCHLPPWRHRVAVHVVVGFS